ncbi:membrane protein [Caballeronia mineralivorans PML1(12)]|uniref:Membrane protein n=1 Tax=Caballeronia mineralivorans PML1(12) TaxID=908627 RepID=A0A0J1D107_9BURK|nr:DUF4142 domain-containing protein [Caballeronia mineralivorans]KLU26442.1 membrane protein [Caballeronia mineralivorans PML1(12)]
MKAISAALFGALALASFPDWAQSDGPTDPQIAAIVATANQVDIDAGKLAESKTKSADVKAFAQRMITDHGGVNRAAVDHEVAYHQSVLDALDKTLIPSAQNEELKALLVKVRPAFVAHLERAKHLQAELRKSGA